MSKLYSYIFYGMFVQGKHSKQIDRWSKQTKSDKSAIPILRSVFSLDNINKWMELYN